MTEVKKYAETPLMKQYYSAKSSHPEAILLFRVGDFYETFGEDAIKASNILNITLTRRANGAASYVELAGFPYHSLNTYLPKLVRAGERVAICEQLEDPKATKKIVKRGITELITPGVSFNDEVLTSRENNFLASLYFDKKHVGVAFLDVTTGEFYAAQGDIKYAEKLLLSFKPKEVLIQKGCREQFVEAFGRDYHTFPIEQWNFDYTNSYNRLINQFEVKSLKGFGIETLSSAISAAGSIIYYLEYTCHNNTKHINAISRIEEDNYVWLDKYTLRNLEIFGSSALGGKALIDIMDKAHSPMGSRTLRRWLSLPLKNETEIARRHDVVEYFINHQQLHEECGNRLAATGDLERLAAKVIAQRCNPRDLLQLMRGLSSVKAIKEQLKKCDDNYQLKKWSSQIESCDSLCQLIATTICEEPAALIQKGGVIARGVSAALDELRELMSKGKSYIVEIQERESARTGIPSLKIGFNNVFGYYIEVRNGHKDKVPEEWTRKQTLTSAERYITAELKEYEEKVLGAQDKALALEVEIYEKLIAEAALFIEKILSTSSIIGDIDALYSFATISKECNYTRPIITSDNILEIKQARHPVIEAMMSVGQRYIPNDIYLDSTSQQIIIITGPNMSGKSALLRTTALMVIMAQVGCFVPAERAVIGITDRIFTRVGASDNISQGESTFMVEMLESANILNNITDRSLVLLDEIGRGTSTYDGISIAWSMVEYLHNSDKGAPKTLFATHYHELNEMEEIYPRIKNFNVQVKEVGNRIIFLRTLGEGGTAHSFGIHVARMAGMPRSVVQRSEEILERMEQRRERMESREAQSKRIEYKEFKEFKESKVEGERQLSLFELEDPTLYQIKSSLLELDINSLTPLEALSKLNEIKNLL